MFFCRCVADVLVQILPSLLELIVINLGLQAGILTTKVFAMFVVHAMILTFIITPLTALIYPEKRRSSMTVWRDSHGIP